MVQASLLSAHTFLADFGCVGAALAFIVLVPLAGFAAAPASIPPAADRNMVPDSFGAPGGGRWPVRWIEASSSLIRPSESCCRIRLCSIAL